MEERNYRMKILWSALLHRAIIKRCTRKPKQVTSHVFAKTTHVAAAPCGFACVVMPPT